MAKKKRSVKAVRRSSSKKSSVSKSSSFVSRLGIAKRNLFFFIALFILSYVLYNFSTSELFLTFFGILSVVVAFLVLAFLISIVVILLSGKKK